MAAHAMISGAGIAGPALAHQLSARGWRTTVVERYPQRRDEGQNIDIRGAGREVVRRMGIDDDVRAANTGEVGTRFVKENGWAAASFRVAAPGANDGPTAELEILRGELSRILIDHTSGHTDYRFDTQIMNVTDHGDRVSAVLQDGTTLDADLLVIAEGLHSRSRRFITAAETKSLGMYLAYATIPRSEDDDHWWKWQHATESRAVHLRPDNLGTTRGVLTFISDVRGFEDLDRAGQLTILRRTFADVGGAAPRVLAAWKTARRCTSRAPGSSETRYGAGAGSRCWATPPSAMRHSAEPVPAWPSSAPTSSPENLTPPTTSTRRWPGTNA
jgi:2-polyprenyl-6-methoxyphenol hydroxylase-like FAD-dependent oxidoreductase